jgi:hypothetical protein
LRGQGEVGRWGGGIVRSDKNSHAKEEVKERQ